MDSKKDSGIEPYLSQYKTKDLLNNIRDVLSNIAEAGPGLTSTQIDALKGIVLPPIGNIDIKEEDLNACEKALKDAEQILLPNALEPEVIILLVNVQNTHGSLLWSFRDKPEEAIAYLLSAKKHCEDFKATMRMPVPIESILSQETLLTEFKSLEKAHTQTLYYLSQAYGDLNEGLKSALYCHLTLRKQLMYKDYDPIEWAFNCATLSQRFVEQYGFFQTRYHLAAASTILEQYEEEFISSEVNDEAYLAKKEKFKRRYVDIARCWVRYCNVLMISSKQRLMRNANDVTDIVTDLSNLTLKDDEKICGDDITLLIFPDLDVSKYEKEIGDKFLLTYEDAREVFICGQGWLNKAKDYYKADKIRVCDYIELVQEHSQLYVYLSYFENNDVKRAKKYKRRIDMLQDLLKDLNPKYHLKYCRQLWYELGGIYSFILSVKLDKLNRLNNLKNKPTTQLRNKINVLCEKSIENYEKLLDSVRDRNGVMPVKIDSALIVPVVSAYAHIGTISIKRIAADRTSQISYVKKSCDAYQRVIDMCKRYPEAEKVIIEEQTLSYEIVNNLPLKIAELERKLHD